MSVWEESTWEVSRGRDDISRVQRPESICALGKSVSLGRFRERLEIATLENPVFVLPWAASGAVRLDSGVRRLRGSRRGVTQRFVVDDAGPAFMPTVADRRAEFPRGSWAVASAIEGMNARAYEREAFCGCCRLLSKTRSGDSSDTFKQKVDRSGRILCLFPRQRQPTNEVDDGYTLSVVQRRQRSKSWEFRDALAKLTEEHYDVWDEGVDI